LRIDYMAEKKLLKNSVTTNNLQNLQNELRACKADLETRNGELRMAQTERIRAEEQLREKAAELTCACRELDSFAGSVTHGLRNGLQTITGFSQTLLKFYYDCLDETGRDCLTRIGTGTKKMKAIMECLHELSRISGQELRREKVDLSEIALEFCSEMRSSDPQRSVECVINPGLIADADPGMARILLKNLLENSWKFTSKNPNACIEFGGLDGTNPPVFFVRDNGVGFDQNHSDKLFKPFQHLHKDEELKGPGIGLASVKRIVYKHGGSVKAESEKGKGTTFYFQFSRT
jgi:light-regulated signal transduction histidine kinase (bacteriophytochrome)